MVDSKEVTEGVMVEIDPEAVADSTGMEEGKFNVLFSQDFNKSDVVIYFMINIDLVRLFMLIVGRIASFVLK